jgi:lambda family phage tail tape measure protein
MNDQLERLGIVIRADGVVETSNGIKLVGKEVQQLADNLGDLGKKLMADVAAAKANAQATQAVGSAATTSAAAVSGQAVANAAAAASHAKHGAAASAAGDALEHFSFRNKQASRELVVLAHEMSQGNYTRFGGSMMVLAEQTGAATLIFSGLGAAILGATAVVGGFAYAVFKGARESENLNNAILATGGYAGQTAGQVSEMAHRIDEATGEGIGHARQAMQSLVASGRFTATSLESVGTAAVLMAKVTGQSEGDVLKHLAAMGNGVTEWAYKANEQYHFLSLAQYKHIKALEDQGKAQDAMRVTGEALIAHFKAQREDLGLLERVLKSTKDTWREWWDAALDVGRQETVEGRLERLQKTLKDKVAQGPLNDLTRGAHQTGVARLQQDIDEAARDQFWGQFTAQMNSGAADKAAEDIKKAHKDDKSHKVPDHTAQSYLDNLQKQLRGVSNESRVYDDVLQHLETNVNKFTLSQGYLALYTAEQIDQLKDKRRASEAEIKYLGQIGTLHDQEIARQAQLRTSDRQELQERQFEISLYGKTAQEADRLTAAYKAQVEWKARLLALMDARQSGAIGSAEFDQGLKDADRRRDDQISVSNAQLAEKYKPGWQKLLDGWKDTTQLMADAHDNAMQHIVRDGEDAWVQLVTTGKLNAKSLVDGVLSEMARLYYRKNIAGPLANFGLGILSNLGLGGGAGAVNSFDSGGMMALIGASHGGGIAGGTPTFRKSVDMGVFAGAPRFHGGGIAGDEVPIIAKRGEGVFTPEQMASMAPAGSSKTITFAPQINIDARTDRAEVLDLVSRAMRASQADLIDQMNRGSI